MENNAVQRNAGSVPQAPYPQITRRRRIPQAPPPLNSLPFNAIPQAPPLSLHRLLPFNNLSHANEATQKNILTAQINDAQLETNAPIDGSDQTRDSAKDCDESVDDRRSSLKRRYESFIRHCDRANKRKDI